MKRIFELLLIVLILLIQLYNGESVENKQSEDIATAQKDVVVHIVDGDTFDIASGKRVRLIGIDTPERGEYFYKEAKERLRELVENKEVILKKDISETDRYGRLLRHVYLDDVWINKLMIEEGYARFVTYPPDVNHVEVFKKAQEKAREDGVGLWKKR